MNNIPSKLTGMIKTKTDIQKQIAGNSDESVVMTMQIQANQSKTDMAMNIL